MLSASHPQRTSDNPAIPTSNGALNTLQSLRRDDRRRRGQDSGESLIPLFALVARRAFDQCGWNLILCFWLLLDHRAYSQINRRPIRAQLLDPLSTNSL